MSNKRLKRFGGVARLYGPAALTQFAQAQVGVIGVGGVGSWVVEALARSGIGRLVLIDMDHIAESNINRQIQALEVDIGKSKVQALAERIVGVNADTQVLPVEEFIEPANLNRLIDPAWNWVVDCIDNSQNKAALIAHCRHIGLNVLSVGAAGGRIDPCCIKVADLSAVTHDALLAKTRTILRREHAFSNVPKQKFGVSCVYSTEQPRANSQIGSGGLHCNGYGSIVTVTATFGFTTASVVLNQLAKESTPPPTPSP